MPLHDWTQVPSDLYHDFHQSWTVRIAESLNSGLLPSKTSALVEQRIRKDGTHARGFGVGKRWRESASPTGLLIDEPPTTQIVCQGSPDRHYAERANRITIKHQLRRTMAVIEITSPGNKNTRAALKDFIDKSIQFLRANIHLLIVDPFPPTPRDPHGIHKAIWDQIEDEPFVFPTGKDRIFVSYLAGVEHAAYIEPMGVGDALPDMPLFLAESLHVPVPLEQTYQATWAATPEELKRAVETGVLPDNV